MMSLASQKSSIVSPDEGDLDSYTATGADVSPFDGDLDDSTMDLSEGKHLGSFIHQIAVTLKKQQIVERAKHEKLVQTLNNVGQEMAESMIRIAEKRYRQIIAKLSVR